MAKKNLKDAATAGSSVINTIVNGGVQYAQYATDAQHAERAENAERAEGAKHTTKKERPKMERLNLSIPAEIKEYLQEAAYRESSPQKFVSLTQYLCQLVRADMEKHRDK